MTASPQFTKSPSHKFTDCTSLSKRFDVLPAVLLANVAGGDRWIVLEKDQILAVDRLADERPLEREGVHRIQVVAHDPRLVDVGRRRHEIGSEHRRAAS